MIVLYLVNLETADILKFSVWIGGSDLQVEGVFVWSDSGNNFTFTNWLGSQPDNARNNEHCVGMIALTGTWNDWPCSHSTLFVCEKNIQ